jgi:hypothetical protein
MIVYSEDGTTREIRPHLVVVPLRHFREMLKRAGWDKNKIRRYERAMDKHVGFGDIPSLLEFEKDKS